MKFELKQQNDKKIKESSQNLSKVDSFILPKSLNDDDVKLPFYPF